MGAKSSPGVVQRLVDGVAVGAEPVRDDVDRHAVDQQCHHDPPLVVGQRLRQAVAHRGGEITALDERLG
jgi:hypothetical protein